MNINSKPSTMIQINKITPPTVDVYGSGDAFLGTLNEYELLDFRVQIKENRATGYYLIHNGEKIRIDQNGKPESWPDGLLDTMPNLLVKLI